MMGRPGRPGWRGPEWPGDWRGWRGGGRRMRRGDIRTALLTGLTDGPAHGYEIISRLEQKSGGTWRPSPGSVYPTLQLFEDEGLVRSEERDGKRVYELTDAGRAEAAERAERFGAEPWNSGSEDDSEFHGLLRAAGSLMVAAKQIARLGDASQLQRATAAIRATSKQLYQMLAED
jgi:DNA-binding PadR family transcriptional regulator